MRQLVEWLRQTNEELDKLKDRTVVTHSASTTGSPGPRDAETLAAALRRRKIVRER